MTEHIDPYHTYTRAEVAEMLRVSVNHVSRLVNRGALFGIRSGKRILVTRASIEDYLDGKSGKLDSRDGIGSTRSLFAESVDQ